MMENSIPITAPGQDKAQVEELIRSEEFLGEIMGNMTKTGQEPLQRIATNNRMEAVELKNQNQEVPEAAILATPAQEQQIPPENNAETGQEMSATIPTEQQDPYEKRWRDSQAMIGRQSNEIGQLRKQLSEIQKKVENPGNQEETERYYEKIAKMPEDDVAKLLIKDAANRDEQIDPILAKQLARSMKASVQVQLDIVKDALKPIQEMTLKNEERRQIFKKDTEWYSAHPEHEKRQAVMKQFIDSAYPGGLEIRNEYNEVIGMKADPYVVAHLAYEYAGKITSAAQQSVDNLNNQRIAAGRSLNTATQGAVQGQGTAPKPKLDALHAETERVFEQIAPTLLRSRG